MEDEVNLPLTDALFTTEDVSNIASVTNERVLPTPIDLLSPLVAQESGFDYEKSKMVCGGVVWTWAYQERDTTQLSSVENNLGLLDTHVHTTHHYTPQLVQLTLQTATHNTQVACDNSHFTCECYINGGVECMPNSGVTMEEVGNPPDTQQFVSGLIAFKTNHTKKQQKSEPQLCVFPLQH